MRRSAAEPRMALTHGSACAGGVDTTYLHAGRGAPLVVLAPPASNLAQELLAHLAGNLRVIIPERAGIEGGRAAPLARWLPDFMDALGLGRTAFVADARSAGPLLAFALLEPDRALRLLFACDGSEAAAGPLEDELSRAGVRLLVASCPDSADPGLTAIRRFLLMGDEAPA